MNNEVIELNEDDTLNGIGQGRLEIGVNIRKKMSISLMKHLLDLN